MQLGQLSLFGREAPRFDATFRRIERLDLDPETYLLHHPTWLAGDATLLAELASGVAWEQTTQVLYDRVVDTPRLVADLTPRPAPDAPRETPAIVVEIGDVLSAYLGVTFDSISAALYRDGRDSVAWHRDRNLRERESGFVATVSLGEPRPFLLRPRGGGAPSRRLTLGRGDLLVMSGACQRTWEHAVPKVSYAPGPRLVLMYRHNYEASADQGATKIVRLSKTG